MPEPFKNKINAPLIQRLAAASRAAWSGFDALEFSKAARQDLEAMELKARIDHVTRTWARYLPKEYPAALALVLKTLPPKLESEAGWGDVIFFTWIHSHFVQVFGLEDPDRSLKAMLEITQRGSCEFAVRPFLRLHPKKTRAFLAAQIIHPSAHVRRWISEGSRPRLPWGERLASLVEDPAPNLALLRALAADSSLYVRTSVANHVGDIAKDHPKIALTLVEEWKKGSNPHAAWMARKALRHLVKAGHAGALKATGFKAGSRARLKKFTLETRKVRVGESLGFETELRGGATENLSVDYAVDFMLASGKRGRKVFKLAAKKILKGETLRITKAHRFRPITTRRYYPGAHRLSLLVNGVELGGGDFVLLTTE